MNRKHLIWAVLTLITLGIASSAFAGTYTFTPNPANFNDLDHYKYYSWGIKWAVPTGETITSAVFSIANINNWAVEPGNRLFIHLMGGIPSGVKTYNDNDSYNGGPAASDSWAGQGVLLTTYHDSNPNVAENLIYDFGAQGMLNTFKSYVAGNTVWGFGLDPDCHYYNCGAKLVVKTEPPKTVVPEPGGLAALCTGLMSICGLASKRRRA